MACSGGEMLKLETVHYFVAKCKHISNLYEAMRTCVWACARRLHPPQPCQVLSEAFASGRAVLVFSVNNSHGWHGYAKMITCPNSESTNETETEITDDGKTAEEETTSESKQQWHKFRIDWQELCLKEHGDKPLPFSETSDLNLLDGTPLNKARNFQELLQETGTKLCTAISKHLQSLSKCKCFKESVKSKKGSEPFFTPTDVENANGMWRELLSRVQTLGTVMLACYFGSRRYVTYDVYYLLA